MALCGCRRDAAETQPGGTAGAVPLEVTLAGQTQGAREWSGATFEEIGTITGSIEMPLWGPLAAFGTGAESVFVVDYGDALIKEFDPKGRLLRVFGSGRGEGPGEFLNPTDVKVRNDTVFVADGMSRTLSVFDRSGSLINSQDSPLQSISRIAVPAATRSIVLQGNYREGKFASFNPGRNLKLNDSQHIVFGKLISDFRSRNSLLSGLIQSTDDGFVFVPRFYGAIISYSVDGTLNYARETIAAGRDLPTIESTTIAGGFTVRPVGRVYHNRISIVDEMLVVQSRDLHSYRSDSIGALDFYESATGDYKYSVRLPRRVREAILTEDYLFGTADTLLYVWRMQQ